MKESILSRIPRAVRITSRQNPLVVSLSKLEQAKYRREAGLFLAEGVKLSREACGMPEAAYVLLSSDDGMAEASLLDVAASFGEGTTVVSLPESVFAKISTENAPQGIITVLREIPRLHRTLVGVCAPDVPAGERILALDRVQDPGNLGTMIRTACAFGYRHLLFGGCADIYHPRTVRAAMGTLFRMHIDRTDDLAASLAALRQGGRRILSAALTDNSLTLGEASLCRDDCVVVGNEGHGVSPEVLAASDAAIRIPMAEGCESLNAAGAAAVLMWEYYRSFDH